MLLKLLTPHLQIDRVTDVQPAIVRALGVEGLLLDLDCTLMDYHAADFSPDVVEWVELMKREQVAMCILSNGRGARIRPLAQRLGLQCVPWAGKPFTFGLRAALAKLALDRTRVALVGDQIFADVLAGRIAGVFTILVRPTTTREAWITYIKRPLERLVLRAVANADGRDAKNGSRRSAENDGSSSS